MSTSPLDHVFGIWDHRYMGTEFEGGCITFAIARDPAS
jgi:hypothetical protein